LENITLTVQRLVDSLLGLGMRRLLHKRVAHCTSVVQNKLGDILEDMLPGMVEDSMAQPDFVRSCTEH